MTIIFLIGSIFMTGILAVLAFENIAAVCTFLNFFFLPIGTGVSPTMLFFAVAFMGIITGMFYYGLFHSLFSKRRNEEDEEDEDF